MDWNFLIRNKDSICVTTDSRKITPGCVFVALKGEHFDGNLFVDQAIKDGAAYVIKGEHALAELQDLARAWRRYLGLPILAITGTNGKTTTKELTAQVLKTKYNLHYTQGNFNNALGVPLTLLQLTRAHEMAIVEMGASHPGDIKELVDIAEPDYGLITNVGKAHLQGFGSFEGVMRTKAELYDYLLAKFAKQNSPDMPTPFPLGEGRGEAAAKPVIFLNASNPHLQKMLSDSLRATGLPSDLIGTSLELHRNFIGTSLKCYTTISMPTGTHLVGEYNAENIAAALCVGEYFGVPREQGLEAVRAYVPTNNRSQAMHTDRNELVIDAYNANPTSMAAAIEAFTHIAPCPLRVKDCRSAEHIFAQDDTKSSGLSIEHLSQGSGKGLFFILGAMRELGEYTHEEHQNIVNMLLERRVEQVLLVGQEFADTTAPYPIFEDVAALRAYLMEHPIEGKRILIKGSHSTQLETIIDLL